MATGTVAKTRRHAQRTHCAPLIGVRFTPDQFEHLGQVGLLNSLRVERIGEEVVQMPSIEPEHGSTGDYGMAFNARYRALRYSGLDALVSPLSKSTLASFCSRLGGVGSKVSPLSKSTLAIPVRALLGGEE
jgi:hypothetical protein